jgi:hypothetical protein
VAVSEVLVIEKEKPIAAVKYTSPAVPKERTMEVMLIGAAGA